MLSSLIFCQLSVLLLCIVLDVINVFLLGRMTEHIYLTINLICNFSIRHMICGFHCSDLLLCKWQRWACSSHAWRPTQRTPSCFFSRHGVLFLQRPHLPPFPSPLCICLVNHFHILQTCLEAVYQTDINVNEVV